MSCVTFTFRSSDDTVPPHRPGLDVSLKPSTGMPSFHQLIVAAGLLELESHVMTASTPGTSSSGSMRIFTFSAATRDSSRVGGLWVASKNIRVHRFITQTPNTPHCQCSRNNAPSRPGREKQTYTNNVRMTKRTKPHLAYMPRVNHSHLAGSPSYLLVHTPIYTRIFYHAKRI